MSDVHCDFSANAYLGAGSADVSIAFRGGIREVPITSYESVRFTRELDRWGEATLIVKMSDCCQGINDLADVDPRSHELIIRRSDNTGVQDAFVGVIMTISYKQDQIEIYARSLDAWWNRVVVFGAYKGHPRIVMEEIIDKSNVQLGIGLQDMTITRTDDELDGERRPAKIQASDLMEDLTSNGFHYTVIGRTVLHGEILHANAQGTFLTTLSPDQFIDPDSGLELIKSGLAYSSTVTMLDLREPSDYYSVTDEVPEPYYGDAENLYSGGDLGDSGLSVQLRAKERLRTTSRIRISVPGGTYRLAPHAQILFGELIPGLPIMFNGVIGCIEFSEMMSSGTIEFNYSREGETISVGLAPMIVVEDQ